MNYGIVVQNCLTDLICTSVIINAGLASTMQVCQRDYLADASLSARLVWQNGSTMQDPQWFRTDPPCQSASLSTTQVCQRDYPRMQVCQCCQDYPDSITVLQNLLLFCPALHASSMSPNCNQGIRHNPMFFPSVRYGIG